MSTVHMGTIWPSLPRMTYASEAMAACIFCEIVRGTASAHRIWEDNKHLAFLSTYPNTAGFAVVVTKTHFPSDAFVAEDAVLADLVVAAKKVGKKITAAFEDVGRTGLI
ncbi:MAG: histidine triad (HIT) protein, partial [Parcubacteria group bacterium Gr01-1014_106]